MRWKKGHANYPFLVAVLGEVLAAAACYAAFRFFSPEGNSLSWRPALSTISPNQLLQEANTALSQARQQGRSQIALYSSIMSAAIERRIAIERDLEEERNHDFPSFSLHYQPQFDAEQQICGAEALIRWKKDNGTLVAPDEFIPIAEESGHIHAMARWVITEACRQIAEWRENYDLTIPIAINISAKQFEPLPSETSLALLLEQTLENLSIPTYAIELEITETALLNSGDAAMHRSISAIK